MSGTLSTFRGRNVAEAMRKVREALGADAFVVEKRELSAKKSLFKLGGDEMVEIIATNSPEALAAQPAPAQKRGTLLEKTYGTATPQAAQPVRQSPPREPAQDVQVDLASRRPATPNPAQAASAESGACGGIMEQIREQMLRLASLQARGGFPEVGENLLDAYQRLCESEVNSIVARAIVEGLQREMGQATLDRELVRENVEKAVAARIATCGQGVPARSADRPAVVALVGPCGSGKTTTLVKIAFDAAINRKLKVGIINEDFRRPGAAAQLQGLTHILDLPVVTADTPQSMAEEIRNMAGLDLVLIDTAGRAPREGKGIAELARMLEAARPDEVHLTVAATNTERTALGLARAFAGCGFDRVIMSKLDEAASYGLVLSLAGELAQPFSYITAGQKLSGGLFPAQPELLGGLVCQSVDVAELLN